MDQEDASQNESGLSIPPKPTEITKSMDLSEARQILEIVVATREDDITENTDLSHIGDFDVDTFRTALKTVTQSIMSGRNSKETFGSKQVKKETSKGTLRLSLHHKISDGNVSEPRSVYLALNKNGSFVLESEVPLVPDESPFDQSFTRFADFRNGTNVSFMSQVSRESSIEKYRHLWKGVRWLSANLLSWNGDIALPEQLEKPQLPAE